VPLSAAAQRMLVVIAGGLSKPAEIDAACAFSPNSGRARAIRVELVQAGAVTTEGSTCGKQFFVSKFASSSSPPEANSSPLPIKSSPLPPDSGGEQFASSDQKFACPGEQFASSNQKFASSRGNSFLVVPTLNNSARAVFEKNGIAKEANREEEANLQANLLEVLKRIAQALEGRVSPGKSLRERFSLEQINEALDERLAQEKDDGVHVKHAQGFRAKLLREDLEPNPDLVSQLLAAGARRRERAKADQEARDAIRKRHKAKDPPPPAEPRHGAPIVSRNGHTNGLGINHPVFGPVRSNGATKGDG
jgi:hypothetical protein